MFLMIRDGVPYLTYVSYAAYVLMSRGKRRKIVIVSSLQKSDEPKKRGNLFGKFALICIFANNILQSNTS